jgi:hypothetical protein
MNTQSLITRTTIVFAVLAITGLAVAVSSQFVADAPQRTILVAVGSALFGASLSFFLTRFFSLVER